MVSVPQFTMGGHIRDDWMQGTEGVSNALGQYYQRGLQNRKIEQDQRQFEAQNLLARNQFGELQRQHGVTNALARDQMGQQNRQFGESYALDKGRFDLAKGEADERRAAEFNTRAAGVGQMILEDQDPDSRAATWQKLVSSDPRRSAALAKSGIDLADPVAGAKFIIAQARGYREPEPYKITEHDPTKELIGINPRTQESRTIRAATDGGFKPKDRADIEAGMRKEVEKYAGEYTTLRNAVGNIESLAGKPTAAGDISTVFSFMKILDPSSVVREAEYAVAARAAGVPDRIVNLIEKVQSGQFLTPSQRQDFVATARTIAATQRTFYENKLGQFRSVAERSRVDPNNVVLTEPSNRPDGVSPAAAAGPAPSVAQDGGRFNWVGGGGGAAGGQGNGWSIEKVSP